MRTHSKWFIVAALLALAGCEGPTGPAGAVGEQGPTGATGPTGPEGLKGATGATGPSVDLTPVPSGSSACPEGGVRMQVGGGVATYVCNGLDGMAGTHGATGATGPTGPTGSVGPTGPVGAQGDPGLPGTAGQDVYEAVGSGQLVVTPSLTTYTLVPGLLQSVNVPPNAVVYVSTSGGLQSTGATGATCSVVDVGVFLDTNTQPSVARRVSIANTTTLAQLVGNWSMSKAFTNLPAGSHTFAVGAASGMSGLPCASAANVSSAAAPQLQGVLTVVVLNR